MKKIIVLCIAIGLGNSSYSQTKKTTPEKKVVVKEVPAKQNPPKKVEDVPSPMNEEELNAKWMAYMTPGQEHEALASEAGDWTEEITIWTHAGAEPTTSVVNVKIEMILGGRYQQSVHTGEVMGMPFEGIGITAFDNASKKYYSSWIDNMGTGLMFSAGTVDPKTKSIVFLGEQPDPITGKTTVVREVMTKKGENEMILEMYNTPHGGKEFMSMKIIMKR